MNSQYDGAAATRWRTKTLAETTIQGLARRNMTGLFVETRTEAAELLLSLIPSGASLGFGGSVTLHDLGVYERLKQGPYRLFDRYLESLTAAEKREVERQALLADVFLTGTNAITTDGRLVNVDYTGNRVAAMIFGPRRVIVACGINKVCFNLDEAVSRVKNRACPANARRAGMESPCIKTGTCLDCRAGKRICSYLTVIEGQKDPERLTVILIGEEMGF